MAYDQNLAKRIQGHLSAEAGFEEKKMFGGVGMLIHGNMACGVHGSDLIVRVGVENHARAMARPHTAPFDMTVKPMAGWIVVRPDGFATDEQLTMWINEGLAYAKTLPPK